MISNNNMQAGMHSKWASSDERQYSAMQHIFEQEAGASWSALALGSAQSWRASMKNQGMERKAKEPGAM